MTKGRCAPRKKMMGRGANGGCGTGEKHFSPVSRVPKLIEKQNKRNTVVPVGIDFYSQARKALTERSPFDSEDVAGTAVHTLPSGLAGYLNKVNDSHRKRHKKSHSGAETRKKSSLRPDKARGRNIWVETEEYFRGLNVEDVDKLYEVSRLRPASGFNYFLIPPLGNANFEAASNADVEAASNANVEAVSNPNVETASNAIVEATNTANGEAANDANGIAVSVANGNGMIGAKEEDIDHLMEVDSIGDSGLPLEKEEEKDCSVHQPCGGVEWLLGSRTKIYLASERPSKKRKLLGGDAGLEKLFVACPVKEASATLCHYCSLGNTDDQLNQLIVCSSCSVAVHERCYGVQTDESDSWLCSWCKQHKDRSKCVDRPCVLCPQQGGALKPVRKRGESDNGGPVEFAHLFCCQWMPEVYIEDTRTMEPILNVEGMKETRRKLICYLCKGKCGACVRCSNGACRTSFHPICAREARHRMEIWGKLGCDDVELRAFCANHSEVPNNSKTEHIDNVSVAVGSGCSVNNPQPEVSSVKKPHKLKIGRRNGDKLALDVESGKLGGNISVKAALSDTRSNSRCHLQLQADEGQQSISINTLGKKSAEDVCLFLKQLIDQGKVQAKEVASEIGVPLDLLPSNLIDNHMVPDLKCKITNWLKNHDYLLAKNLRVKFKSAILSKAGIGVRDDKAARLASQSDVPEVLNVKSVPPRRRTKNNIRVSKDDEVISSSQGSLDNGGSVMNVIRESDPTEEDSDFRSKESHSDAMEKVSVEPSGVSNILANNSPECEGDPAKSLNGSLSGPSQAEEALTCVWNTMVNSNPVNYACSFAMDQCPNDIKRESISGSYIHPLIRNKLLQLQNQAPSRVQTLDHDDSREGEVCTLEASSSSGICCNQQSQSSSELLSQVHRENLVKARNMNVLDLSPADEVVGELVYYQHRLLCNAVARKRFTDDLIRKVIKSLPREIDVLRNQNWDAVLVNQYLCEVRKAKKQGRKERRHKEAQAVLAAAASSRISSFRKDTLDDSASQDVNLLKVNSSGGRAGVYSQQMPRTVETLSRLGVARDSSEKDSDSMQSTLEFSKEHSRTCDICRRAETILNPILVCSSCKVTVHLGCYRSVKESTGPWYCELCEDLSSSRSLGASALNSLQKPTLVAECGLCGGTAGAFRKSTDGQWIHAFCAEWVLESTFSRGQINPIEGMETIAKGSDFCLICGRKQGVCVKCNYGHCQSTFHPSCARSAGFYLNMRTSGGKLQHKAYCEKHSLVERAKAETQKHGAEEWNSLKKVRVELERLRLICERIIKREKLKRELVLCSHDLLGSNRDAVVSSARVCTSFFPPAVSSESDTTSLKGYTDGYKSGSEAIQRSDDITVDSSIAGKRRIRFPMSMDNDRKTDDSSTSQHFVQRTSGRSTFSGKQIPQRTSSAVSKSNSDDGEKPSKYRKHTETFEKELVMTSDEASMRNQRLPKGFVYFPIRCLSSEKESVLGTSSQEQSENDE